VTLLGRIERLGIWQDTTWALFSHVRATYHCGNNWESWPRATISYPKRAMILGMLNLRYEALACSTSKWNAAKMCQYTSLLLTRECSVTTVIVQCCYNTA